MNKPPIFGRTANQLGRRNLSPDDYKLLVGMLYNQRKKGVGAPNGNENAKKQRDQIDPFEKTAEQVATETGLSPARSA